MLNYKRVSWCIMSLGFHIFCWPLLTHVIPSPYFVANDRAEKSHRIGRNLVNPQSIMQPHHGRTVGSFLSPMSQTSQTQTAPAPNFLNIFIHTCSFPFLLYYQYLYVHIFSTKLLKKGSNYCCHDLVMEEPNHDPLMGSTICFLSDQLEFRGTDWL